MSYHCHCVSFLSKKTEWKIEFVLSIMRALDDYYSTGPTIKIIEIETVRSQNSSISLINQICIIKNVCVKLNRSSIWLAFILSAEIDGPCWHGFHELID